MGRIGKTFAFILILIIAMSCPTLLTIEPTNAQTQNDITINPDGSITPSSAPIQQTGTVYVLKNSVRGIIAAQASSIVLEGNGHTVSAIILNQLSNVTIKDFIIDKDEKISLLGLSVYNSSNCLIYNNTVKGFWSVWAMNGIDVSGIFVIGGNSNLFAKNVIKENLSGMEIINSSQNVITQNSFKSNSEYTSLIHFITSSDNTIYNNNFVCENVSNTNTARVYYSKDAWDNGTIGNYWSDYKGNGEYVIDSNNIDHYPLTKPIDIYSIITPTPSPTVPEFPFIAILSLLVVIPLITVLVKKRVWLKVYN